MIIPAPTVHTTLDGQHFLLTDSTRILAAGDEEVVAIAERFASWLRAATRMALPVVSGTPDGDGDIVIDVIAIEGDADEVAGEAYELRADSTGVRISAATPAGAFRGLTTLRQLLPDRVESATIGSEPAEDRTWAVAGCEVRDEPRFAYRSVMLDVSRHFFPVDDVLRLIDLAALYKLNHVHLHLTDDQGWRLTVPSWPLLTEVGGPTDIDGGAGGFYTTDDLARIVRHAAERYVEIVGEVDVPGHATAALRAYPELGCDGTAPPPRTSGGVTEAALCVDRPATLDFVADVFDVVDSQIPGTFLHIGGDEAFTVAADDYHAFITAATQLVADRGRRAIAWHEAASAKLAEGTVIQYWAMCDDKSTAAMREVVARGHQLILSVPQHAYLDMKYDASTPYGLEWAGPVPASNSYDWDPATSVAGVPAEAILGIEAPLWTETVPDRAAMDHMYFPRLASIAEVGWSPATRDWADHRERLAAHGRRWDLLGVAYYRTDEIPWAEGDADA